MRWLVIVLLGCATAYLAFEGEGHGFRRAENLRRSLEAELYFYGKVFGFSPADAIEDSFGMLVVGVKPKDIPKAKVDLDSCIACEYCVDACPFDCITMEKHPDGQFPMIAVVDEKKCTGCRLCEESCLWESIYMDGERNTFLSQTPLKTTFFDKIQPKDVQTNDRDEAGFMKKEYFVEEKKEESAAN
jgi:formate hydrogenlyase subunit 6/NADH:ubiquinone oxidoreductase subunit I